MAGIVWRSSWRYLRHRPWQMILAVLGIALGVAVVVAVDLANKSAGRAFQLSMDKVSGRATHQIIGGPTGLDERVYTRLRIEGGVRQSAPVVEGYGKTGDETLHLLGVDPLAEAAVRGHLEGTGNAPIRALLTLPNTVLLADTTARRLDLTVGEYFRLEIAGHRHTLRLAGLLKADAAAAIDELLIADIATAQALTGYLGRLSWIDLVLPEGAPGIALHARIISLLPAGVELVPAKARSVSMAQMTRAFGINLTAMSLLALVVGMFLIYNTIAFSVLQRRRLIGILRILGVTREEIFRVVLGEALAVGLTGTALGLLLGVALGENLVRLVTRTINDLYFVLSVNQLLIAPSSLVKGLLLGLGATAIAALAPAIEAAGTTPHAALSRSILEGGVRSLVPRLALSGVVLALGALLFLWLPSKDIVLGFAGLFMLILGFTLTTPLLVVGMIKLANFLLHLRSGFVGGIPLRLAVRGIHASLSRTGVAIAALMLAVSATVGVGVMIASFRATVDVWLQSSLRADIYVSAPSLISSHIESHLDPKVIERVKQLPGIAEVSSARRVTVEAGLGLTEILALAPAPGRVPRFLLKAGDPQAVWPAFKQNRAVLVSEPYAYHHDVAIGDFIKLRTDAGIQSLPVAGIYYDYGSEQGVVLMPRGLYDRYFHDRSVSSLGVYVAPGVSINAALTAIRAATTASEQNIVVRANRDIRTASLEIFDRTFAITNVLRALAVLVAFVGILSALMALQLERAKELAVLRATGFTPKQIFGVVTLQTGFMGLAAGVIAIPVGLVLALVLIHVINRRAFGWSMQTLVTPEVLLQAVLIAVVAALIAGFYPAWKMGRVSPADALREE